MKKIKGNLNSLIMSLCEIVLGVLLIIDPLKYTSGIIIAVGAVLICLGIIDIVTYIRTPTEIAVREHTLLMGMIYVTVGLFCVIRSEWFISVLPIITVLYGIMILLSGMMKIQWTVNSIRLKRKGIVPAVISAAVSVIAAIVILVNPFTSTVVLWYFTAISLILGAVLDIVLVFLQDIKDELEV